MPPDRLAPQDWMELPATRRVMAALAAAGGEDCARFVGGCVRDTLLGRVPAGGLGLDIDIATPLLPAEVVAALEAAGLRAVPTGIAHGTVTAVAQGRPFEITTLRRDVETDGRRAVVAFTADWNEDAARRDFRLNALYAAPEGRLFDPTGEGVADALAGRVVFVGDAVTRIREDYLRILRFFRFAAWYGSGPLDAAGLAACAALKTGIAGLSAERIGKELLKLLAAPDPRAALEAMAETGVLAACAPGLPADPPALAAFHRLAALETADEPADALLRLAALLPPHQETLLAAARRMRLPNAQRDRLLEARAPRAQAAVETPADRRRLVRELGATAAFDRARLARAADDASPAWPQVEALARSWTPPAFPVSGADARRAGFAAGPALGAALRTLEAQWVAADFALDREALLARLVRLAPG